MKIKIIEPWTSNNENTEEDIKYFKSCLSQDDNFEIVFNDDDGLETLESVSDESFLLPGIIKNIIKAEKQGFDGVYVNCSADPGLFQAKELVKIPVVGPLSSSILLGSVVGKKITILSNTSNNRECEEYWIERTGLSHLVSKLRFSELSILDLLVSGDPTDKTFQACKDTVENDNCDVIILGCTCMFHMVDELRRKLQEENINVQIVEPVMASLKMLRTLVEMNLTGSFNGRISSHINGLDIGEIT